MTLPLLELWFRAADAAEDRSPARPRLVRDAARRGIPPDDLSVVPRIRAGEEGAFDTLYVATFRDLWSLARRYVGVASAEDVVQDVFLRLWERRAVWDVRTTVRAYLFGAVRNRALHHAEHASVEQRASLAVSAATGFAEPVTLALDGEHEMFGAVAQAVQALPERQRAAMILRVQRGLSHAELGDALGISAAAAGALVRKAEAKLRLALREYLPEG